MSSPGMGNDQSRERLVALVLLLQNAPATEPLTQEVIVRELMIDEYPVSAKGPRKIRAYQGNETAIRQKFERDKARIRELGFAIDTLALPDGGVGYRIDPASGYAPPIDFTEEEEQVVQMALRFCGFGSSGAFSVFNEGPASDGGVRFTNDYTPALRAINLRRALAFGYHSSVNKSREVEPLLLNFFGDATYLVARVRGTDEIKGYRFDRITSMPVVSADSFEVDDATLALAQAWRPAFSKGPKPVDVVLTTNENYAELLRRQFPHAVAARKRDGKLEVGISFDSQSEAMDFVLQAAQRVRLESPKSLKSDLSDWLKHVNRGATPSLQSLKFPGPATNDVLGQTLQLLHAVYLAPKGLRVSELATRFALAPELVRYIMDRLVAFEPMNGEYGFPAHVVKECDDWDNEQSDDSTYYADFFDRNGPARPSPLMWRDLFELNVALREASRVYTDPAVNSAIDKIEEAVRAFVQVELTSNEPRLSQVQTALVAHEQIKIAYTPATAEEATIRSIEPREIKVLNGHTYVRAYCATREAWRTFRVDRINSIMAKSPATEPRPVDTVANWLTQVGDEGDEVVVCVEAPLRWLFEPLPNAQWLALDDGRHAVKFRVSNESFLDHLMLRAGAGAVVATPQYAKAGHELAKRIADRL
jgi:proteasome accessory factor C